MLALHCRVRGGAGGGKMRKVPFMWVRLPILLLLLGSALLAWGYAGAIAEPTVRRADLRLADWPAGAPPVKVLLISDIHVAGPDMPPERLTRIVETIGALRPDLVLISGDFVSDKRSATRFYAFPEAVSPLSGLKARFGVFAVLGNHDYWRDAGAARAALAKAGVRVLDNEAVQVGPLALGGIGDAYSNHARLARTIAAMRRLEGAKILLSHTPDPFPDLPADIGLMLAGHTHCGQIRLPLIGAISTMSKYGERYACGIVRERGRTLVVAAGLGTSILPLRIGAPPDMWLVRIGGRAPKPAEGR
jgi:predicted MPP superfamily phosphohydrolase